MLEKANIFKNDSRRLIYQFILKNPGIHFRDLSRRLNLKIYNLKYHISILIKNGYIIQKKEGGFVRFFVQDKISNSDKKIFFYLRQKTTRNIILITLSCIAISQKELCELLEKSPSTINFHINKLLKEGIIEIAPSTKEGIISRIKTPRTLKKDLTGREIVFRLKEPATIYRLFNKYKNTILDRDTKILLDAINISVKLELSELKKGKLGLEHYGSCIELGYEIFPHPYHV
jgi:DNA-binding MarR family transcriptional regulator